MDSYLAFVCCNLCKFLINLNEHVPVALSHDALSGFCWFYDIKTKSSNFKNHNEFERRWMNMFHAMANGDV